MDFKEGRERGHGLVRKERKLEKKADGGGRWSLLAVSSVSQ